MIALIYLAGIVQLVCWIIVLVKIFQAGNIGLGIVGIICGLVAFVYGWMKSNELGVQKVMLVWTIALVAQIALSVMFGPQMAPR